MPRLLAGMAADAMTQHDRRHKLPVHARQRGLVHVTAPCASGKRGYLNRQYAVGAARWADGHHAGKHYVYRCRDCRQYHLTTQRSHS